MVLPVNSDADLRTNICSDLGIEDDPHWTTPELVLWHRRKVLTKEGLGIEGIGSGGPASEVTYVPSGTLDSENVQDALDELEADATEIRNALSTTYVTETELGDVITTVNGHTTSISTIDADITALENRATALETKTVETHTGTTYTFSANDEQNRFHLFDNAAATTVTVPANATVAFAVGSTIAGVQYGAGQVTFEGAVGVTIRATPGLKISDQYGSFELVKIATNEWVLLGRLEV